MTYRAAVIGIGPDPDERSPDGYAVAYRHAEGFQRSDACELVACADSAVENAAAFARSFDVDSVYTDHELLLEEDAPDVVSVCVPPPLRAAVARDCATAGSVVAIHCDAPMATTWGECEKLVEVCRTNDVQLTVGHQRRFATPVQEANRLLESGAIGRLRRIEWSEANLFLRGTHLFDLCDYFTGGTRPQWVLAGVDVDPDNRWSGTLSEVVAVAQWEYDDGTMGFASTADGNRQTLVDAYLRLVGADGVIEIQPTDGPPVRVRTDGRWRTVDTAGETVHGRRQHRRRSTAGKLVDAIPGLTRSRFHPSTHHERAIEHLVTSLDSGTEPVISGRRALRGTELIFACWESARRRERIDLPLDVTGNPLSELCEEQYGRAHSRRVIDTSRDW